jgi:hypothetical protein
MNAASWRAWRECADGPRPRLAHIFRLTVAFPQRPKTVRFGGFSRVFLMVTEHAAVRRSLRRRASAIFAVAKGTEPRRPTRCVAGARAPPLSQSQSCESPDFDINGSSAWDGGKGADFTARADFSIRTLRRVHLIRARSRGCLSNSLRGGVRATNSREFSARKDPS